MDIIKIVTYVTGTGKEPFSDWLKKIDTTTRSIIRARLARVRLGNFGDCKNSKGSRSIWELRIDYGAGYRVYFGRKGPDQSTLVILLIGGDKKSQDRDIEKAKRYWSLYEK